MTRSQRKFIEYVRTKQFFELRLKGDDVQIQPIHIKAGEIEKKFFTRFDRKENIQALITAGELELVKKELPSNRVTYYYKALKSGTVDFSLIPQRSIPQDPTSTEMIKHLQNVSLPDDAPNTDYFNVFLKYKNMRMDLFVTIDNFGHRFHSPFASFHRTHRPNVLLYGKETASLDVCTSQPLILGKILFNAIGENEFSKWITEGKDVYLLIQEKTKVGTRDEAKKKFFEILFNKPSDSLVKMFGDAQWIKWINGYKQTPEPNNPHCEQKPHSNLAWLLQRTESMIMRQVWNKLIIAGIPFLTVHDELVVQVDFIQQAEQIMNDVLSNEFDYFKISVNKGVKPSITPKASKSQIKERQPLRADLIALLSELINKVPANIPVTIDNETLPCFRTAISMILEGWQYAGKQYRQYWEDRIEEIYSIMALSGHEGFINKY